MARRGRKKATGFLVDWRNANGRRIRTRFQVEQEAIDFKREMTRQVNIEKMAVRCGKVIRMNAKNRPEIDRLLELTAKVAIGKIPARATMRTENRRASV